MIIQNDQELQAMKTIGSIVASIRDEMKDAAKPGMTTKELDELGAKLFDKFGAVSAPKQEYDFPGFTCISVNEEVAHGIPGDRVIQEGDLVNIDVSGSKDGFYADTGISFVVGKENEKLQDLCEAVKKSFDAGLRKIKAGSKLNGIGKAVHNEARKNGYTVIKNLTGHGVGKSLHEDPAHIMNYFDPWDNGLLADGMVIAFEPFVSTNAEEIVQESDGWTFVTEDKSYVAQIEHTIVVTKGEPIILTL
ncbi:type I methionyl aminopeptidase [Bacillus salacetis]|uniref:Methionine aminopeptidase n=1 Tax=Bacillus salacetis TaxID=2315464 RepID=A0A3A1RBU4_9BACI|nr:type I methionyl aminopeptidase [Bacillus salacetis]RIW38403.1 type I methionyl aminopeptidase [Bacillus salacetis]